MTRQYPRWIHFPGGRSIVVLTPQIEAIYSGYFDSPADFPKPNQVADAVPEPVAESGPISELIVKPKGKPGRPKKV